MTTEHDASATVPLTADEPAPSAIAVGVQHDRRVYTAGKPTWKEFDVVEMAIGKMAHVEAVKMAAFDPGILDEARTKLFTSQHRVGGVLWDVAMGSRDGLRLRLWLVLLVNHPTLSLADVERLCADEPEQCADVLDQTAALRSAAAQELVGKQPIRRKSKPSQSAGDAA